MNGKVISDDGLRSIQNIGNPLLSCMYLLSNSEVYMHIWIYTSTLYTLPKYHAILCGREAVRKCEVFRACEISFLSYSWNIISKLESFVFLFEIHIGILS